MQLDMTPILPDAEKMFEELQVIIPRANQELVHHKTQVMALLHAKTKQAVRAFCDEVERRAKDGYGCGPDDRATIEAFNEVRRELGIDMPAK